MLNGLFKRRKYLTVPSPASAKKDVEVQEEQQLKAEIIEEIEIKDENKPAIPNGMWVKCACCNEVLYRKDLEEHQMTCQYCSTHFRMSARERIEVIIDENSFEEFDKGLTSVNPLNYPGYEEKLEGLKKSTGIEEAVLTGRGTINGEETIIAVMDSAFMMGSMGSVVGEKITRAIEKATESKLPIVIFTASGGARMQEGIFSLMQMAKTSSALARHNEAGFLYITVLTDPTTGGVTASFAMLGDIILAEPRALIGFAGQRVIAQTIKQILPEGFQRAEFLLEHGFVDAIVPRVDLKNKLGELLSLHKEVVL